MKTIMSKVVLGIMIVSFIQTIIAQPTSTVKAHHHYSNAVVIVIPDKAPTVDLTGKKTNVTIYVVENDSNKILNIVNDNKLIAAHKKYKAEIHVRGDATAHDPKKQFEVKIVYDKKENFLGMKKGGKDWVFNDCGAVDPTLMRNVITFATQTKLNQYAPQWKWFELFICDSSATIDSMPAILNNDYWGIYLNFDKIMFSSERINYPYLADVAKDSIFYNYAVLQLNQVAPSKYYSLPLDGTQPIALTAGVQVYEPGMKDLECYNAKDSAKKYSAKDSAKIINNINNWYYTTAGISDTNNWAGKMNNYYLDYLNTADTMGKAKALQDIRKMTDYNSFAVYFLINELSKDPDGYHKSTFMVKNKNTCYAGPLWDKNKSYGNLANNPSPTFFYNLSSGWLFHDSANTVNPNQSPVWWYVLLNDSLFCKQVWSIWKTEYTANGALSDSTLNNIITTQLQFINKPYVSGKDTTSAIKRNNQCWPNAYNQTFSLYNAQVMQLQTYLNNRLIWMNNNLPALLRKSGYKITN